jgi:hypothetical protein
MRQFMNIVETWDRQFKVYGNTDLDVFRNPSRSEFLKLLVMSKHKMLRGLIAENNDLIVWDAAEATHGDVDGAYRKQDPQGFHSAYLLLMQDRADFNDINLDVNENDDYERYHYDWYLFAAVNAAHECPSLVHIYGRNFVPMGIDNVSGTSVEMTPEWLAKNCRPKSV